MHILAITQRRPRKQRSRAEKWFTRIHFVVVVILFATFFVAIAILVQQGESHFSNNFFFTDDLKLSESYQMTLCAENSPVRIEDNNQFGPYTLIVSTRNYMVLLSRFVYNCRRAMAMYACMTVFGTINRYLYHRNIYTISLFHDNLVLRKDVISVLELTFFVLSIITVKHLEREMELMKPFLKVCTKGLGSDAFEMSTWIPIIVGLCVNGVSWALALLVGGYHMIFLPESSTGEGGLNTSANGPEMVLEMSPQEYEYQRLQQQQQQRRGKGGSQQGVRSRQQQQPPQQEGWMPQRPAPQSYEQAYGGASDVSDLNNVPSGGYQHSDDEQQVADEITFNN